MVKAGDPWPVRRKKENIKKDKRIKKLFTINQDNYTSYLNTVIDAIRNFE